MNGDVDVVGVAVLDSGGNVALSWLIWTFDLSIKIFGEEIVHTRTHTGCFNIDGWTRAKKMKKCTQNIIKDGLYNG